MKFKLEIIVYIFRKVIKVNAFNISECSNEYYQK